jgi:heavy metal sensor kinase
MPGSKKPRDVTRWLRFRLTLSYVVFFTILLVAIGFLFRGTLRTILDRQVREAAEQDWALLRANLRAGREGLFWNIPKRETEPEAAFLFERIRRIYLIADEQGRVVQVSGPYHAMGIDPPEEIRSVLASERVSWKVRALSPGLSVLVRGEAVHLGGGSPVYYMAIGRLIAGDGVIETFSWNYFTLMPLLVLGSGLLGWYLAGRALRPVQELAEAARKISGRNLNVRLHSRGAGDELDALVYAFNAMLERLQTSFDKVQRFSTDVSHELRTPITIIRGQLEVALLTAHSEEEYRGAILSALQDVERLSRIVSALLLLSRAETGQLSLRKEEIDLAVVLRDLLEQFRFSATESGLVLKQSIPEECRGEVDRVQFERLVLNLLSNAEKYTPPGGEIRVSLEQRHEVIRLVVEDTGHGIPAEHLPHIFDRLYRVPVRDPNVEKGLGLGLSFVAWIVKAHGGTIRAESQVNEGTRFTVELPVKEGAPGLESAEISPLSTT